MTTRILPLTEDEIRIVTAVLGWAVSMSLRLQDIAGQALAPPMLPQLMSIQAKLNGSAADGQQEDE